MDWLITDPHFNHPNLVARGNRPEGYEALIEGNWRTQASTDDRVICLGDVCMKKAAESHEQYVMPMPGRKILILGNHDRQKHGWYQEHGWDEVYEQLTEVHMVDGRHTRVLFSHIPQPDKGHFDLNVHGHFHNDLHRMGTPEMRAILGDKHRLLALECVGYKLVGLQDFLEGRVEQPGLPQLN